MAVAYESRLGRVGRLSSSCKIGSRRNVPKKLGIQKMMILSWLPMIREQNTEHDRDDLAARMKTGRRGVEIPSHTIAGYVKFFVCMQLWH